jgi:hypothetical protein
MFSIVTSLVFVAILMAMELGPVHRQLHRLAKLRVSFRIWHTQILSGRIAQLAALMAFNAALRCKKYLIYPIIIALIISYYRSAKYFTNICAFNCGSKSFCEFRSSCASVCISAGFLYGWCTSGYLSFTILYSVYMLILKFFL